MMGIFFSFIYPNSHIIPSQANFSLYLVRYFSICILPISSSPSTINLILHGTSPVSRRKYSTAFILVINSPLSSDEPLP